MIDLLEVDLEMCIRDRVCFLCIDRGYTACDSPKLNLCTSIELNKSRVTCREGDTAQDGIRYCQVETGKLSVMSSRFRPWPSGRMIVFIADGSLILLYFHCWLLFARGAATLLNRYVISFDSFGLTTGINRV